MIIAAFFILLGIISMLIPWSFQIRTSIVHFISENPIALFFFGFSTVLIGAALISTIVFNAQRRYYHIQSGSHPITLSETVVYDYLDSYWKSLFPAQETPCRVLIKKKKIQVTADLPFVPILEQKNLLEKIERDLLEMFRDILGYREDLDVSISFASETKS
jgi:hypothetical protein